MGKRDKEVWAKQAKWKHTERDGEVETIVGSFSYGKNDGTEKPARAAAFGCAKHLRKKGWVGKKFEATKYADAYVIHLTSREGHDLEAFETFAHKHDLLPTLKRKRDEADQKILYAEMDEAALHEHRFTPIKGAEAKSLIKSLQWSIIEAPINTGKKSTSDVLVATITDPQEAFRAGYYLQKKGYIPRKQFELLNADINHSLKHNELPTEFRIAICGEKLEQFFEKFPDIDQHKLPEKDKPRPAMKSPRSIT